ncbi:MAG: hypothetical protein JF609_10525 [Verrucomicrobia bacterium]|nr:hypothetical protein [Verrucomicrobiota bacterium]
MSFYARRFNLYLLLLVTACGCASDKKKNEKVGAIRVHVETTVSVPGKSQAIQMMRSDPVVITVSDEPVVTEQNLIAATLLETPGGFAIRVKFDETGAWMLEQATASNPGRHLVIFGQWGETVSETRWIAAPLISRRIGDGIITFTPDASREESQRFVEGLNHTAKKLNTKSD